MWEISILSHQFYCEPKTSVKTKVLKKLLSTSSRGQNFTGLEASGENTFSCLLQLLEASLIPWLMATFHPQSS